MSIATLAARRYSCASHWWGNNTVAITIAKRSIQKISIIDDQAPVRESYELSVEDLGLESVSEAGPLDEALPTCVEAVSRRADAAKELILPRNRQGQPEYRRDEGLEFER